MAQQKGYGQFCPVSRAAEILAERWTPLVIRELLAGSVRFNDLQRGVPRMSSSLLSRRLRELEDAGIVERRKEGGARGHVYGLTQAGWDLRPIIDGMGHWAQRWVRSDLVAKENLDPDILMWDIRRGISTDGMPGGRRIVVQFRFSGVPVARRHYWIVFDKGEADLCIRDPGFDVDLLVISHVRTLTEIWLGHVTIRAALRGQRLQLEGARKDVEAFTSWFALSCYASTGNELPGRATRTS